MRRIIGAAFVSLDGVMQAPGGPTEDPSGGFEHGGWLPPHADEAISEQIGALFNRPFDLLLGRRTYDIFAAYWPFVAKGHPIGAPFDRAAKFVVTGGAQALDWQNSHRLADIEAVAGVKQGDGPDLVIQGSSTLYPQLLRAGLLDRLILMIFPVTLGAGKRLLGEGTPARALRMTEHKVTARGNIIAAYEPGAEIATGSFLEIDPSPAELARRAKIRAGTW